MLDRLPPETHDGVVDVEVTGNPWMLHLSRHALGQPGDIAEFRDLVAGRDVRRA
jgi:hypothetical protein